MPGEISLAHNGVLFLDELPEFKRRVLEVLRQPLEERRITISRTRAKVTYPSSFMLVASMNPSPDGLFPGQGPDSSPAYLAKRYVSKISGPLLDRIDLHIEVQAVPYEKLSGESGNESSHGIRERVCKARKIQTDRYRHLPNAHNNSQIGAPEIREFCALIPESQDMLKRAMLSLKLSARAYDRILKLSRTIADLSECDQIRSEHVAEAIQYRSMDRLW
jgi:magnesium chelatase family protein